MCGAGVEVGNLIGSEDDGVGAFANQKGAVVVDAGGAVCVAGPWLGKLIPAGLEGSSVRGSYVGAELGACRVGPGLVGAAAATDGAAFHA